MLIVPKEDRRRFMMMAHELGMTNGDYVFYTVEMLPEENVLNPEDVWASNDGQNIIAKEAFEAVFHVRSLQLLEWCLLQRKLRPTPVAMTPADQFLVFFCNYF